MSYIHVNDFDINKVIKNVGIWTNNPNTMYFTFTSEIHKTDWLTLQYNLRQNTSLYEHKNWYVMRMPVEPDTQLRKFLDTIDTKICRTIFNLTKKET